MVETFVQSTDDVVKFLTDQHNLIKDMFDEVLCASEPRRGRRRSSNCANCWPSTRPPRRWWCIPACATRRRRATRSSTPGSRRSTRRSRFSELEDMDIGSQEFLDELAVFRDAVVDHAEHEEVEEFFRLKRELDQPTSSES